MLENRLLKGLLIMLLKCSQDSIRKLWDTDYSETSGSHKLLWIIFQSDAPREAELTKQFLDFYSTLRVPLKMVLELRKLITDLWIFLPPMSHRKRQEQLQKSTFTDGRGEGVWKKWGKWREKERRLRMSFLLPRVASLSQITIVYHKCCNFRVSFRCPDPSRV